MSENKIFKGVFTALVTPMKDGEISFDDLSTLVERQISEGVDGLVPAGTTGESPTLSPEEHIEVIRVTVKASRGRVPVIAGSGANSTAEAVHLTEQADQAGADAFLQVTPYYNKPSQEGLIAHFSAVAEITDKPIVLYSIPGRSVIEIAVSTMKALSEKYHNVRCVKESGGKPIRATEIFNLIGSDYNLLSGEDENTLAYLANGGHGVISVASNLLPARLHKMVQSALKNDFESARHTHNELFPLFRDLFIYPSPVPIKYAMAKAGLISSPEVRLPLTPVTGQVKQQLDTTLSTFGI